MIHVDPSLEVHGLSMEALKIATDPMEVPNDSFLNSQKSSKADNDVQVGISLLDQVYIDDPK